MDTGDGKWCRACFRWRDRPCISGDDKEEEAFGLLLMGDLCRRRAIYSRMVEVPRGVVAWSSFANGLLWGLVVIFARWLHDRTVAAAVAFWEMETIGDALPWFLLITGLAFIVGAVL